MAHVTITINGRTYRVECGDGEETRLLAMAERVGQEVDELSDRFGQIGDDRLLLMAALGVADELWDARSQLAALNAKLSASPFIDDTALEIDDLDQIEITDQIDAVADRIEALSQQLARATASGKRD